MAADRVAVDASVVRGLDYYTGPVFEAELTFEVADEDGQTVRFGSVGGGGRYDDLVARFTGQRVPATGFSIGVSRLQAALAAIGKAGAGAPQGPVVVLVMDKAELPRYQKLTQTLRQAGIRAEMYLGTAGMKAQMKYADKRGSPCVVIQGGDEVAARRGADQGPDRGRQGRCHHQGHQGVARRPPGAGLGAGGPPGRRRARGPGAAQGLTPMLVGLFDGGQPLVEHCLDPSFEMRQATHQLSVYHQLEIIAQRPDPAIDSTDAAIETTNPAVEPLLHPAHVIQRLQRQRAYVRHLAAQSPGFGQVLSRERGKQGEVDVLSHTKILPCAAQGCKPSRQWSARLR